MECGYQSITCLVILLSHQCLNVHVYEYMQSMYYRLFCHKELSNSFTSHLYALSIPNGGVVVDFCLPAYGMSQECFYKWAIRLFLLPVQMFMTVEAHPSILCMKLWCKCTKKVHEMAIVGMRRESLSLHNSSHSNKLFAASHFEWSVVVSQSVASSYYCHIIYIHRHYIVANFQNGMYNYQSPHPFYILGSQWS